jgi:hypothetical protein
MSIPMTMHRSFLVNVDGLGELEWNVYITVTCPRCQSPANVNAHEGGTRIVCTKCEWTADTLIDAFNTVSRVLAKAP